MQQINKETGDLIHTQARARFYNGASFNELKSKDAGRPIYDDVEMVHITWAGNTKSELHGPADDRCDRALTDPLDRTRRYWVKWKDHPDFKAAYDAFKAGQEQALNGTPLTELPFLTEGQREELRAVKVFTAEALANLDTTSTNRWGLGDHKRQAQKYLDRAAGAAVDAKYEAERKSMQAEMASMRMQMEALLSGQPSAPAQAIAAKAAAKPKAPGAASPFEAWDDADIRNWMKQVAPSDPPPHNRCNHATLVKMADEIDARLTKEKETLQVAEAA